MSTQLDRNRFETNSHDTYRRGTLTEGETRALTIGWAHFVYGLYQLASKIGMGAVYLATISESVRRLIPSLGAQKIYKLVPLLDHLDHHIDGAHCFALLVLIGTWWSWTQLLETWLGIKPYSRATTVILPLAFVLIGGDMFLFYYAVTQWHWGGSNASWPATLATAMYVAILVAVTFIGIQLKQNLRKAKS
jgi:hypothetical protein